MFAPAFAAALARWPGQCELCRGWSGAALCPACIDTHGRERPRCLRCGLGTGQPLARCGHCLQDPPPQWRTVCALDYLFPWDRLIGQFKFQRRLDLAAPLAALLERALPLELAPEGSNDRPLVVPVPLSEARLAVRGFNQAWELARRVARARGLPTLPDALRRVLNTEAQAGLGRSERQRNLRNAFAPAAHAALQGRDVALVDDVMTTGATAAECAAALLRGGARSVQLWVLARTPEAN
jgi:ComF family protein